MNADKTWDIERKAQAINRIEQTKSIQKGDSLWLFFKIKFSFFF